MHPSEVQNIEREREREGGREGERERERERGREGEREREDFSTQGKCSTEL